MAIDMYESDNELVIQGMIAGVTPENLHISITRTSVTIKGKRTGPQGIPDEHYVSRELYWGPFSRVIELPYEVDTDGAEAIEKYGLLIIRLPKVDTERTAELKVKSIQ
jgi:HSP20 family protein